MEIVYFSFAPLYVFCYLKTCISSFFVLESVMTGNIFRVMIFMPFLWGTFACTNLLFIYTVINCHSWLACSLYRLFLHMLFLFPGWVFLFPLRIAFFALGGKNLRRQAVSKMVILYVELPCTKLMYTVDRMPYGISEDYIVKSFLLFWFQQNNICRVNFSRLFRSNC